MGSQIATTDDCIVVSGLVVHFLGGDLGQVVIPDFICGMALFLLGVRTGVVSLVMLKGATS